MNKWLAKAMLALKGKDNEKGGVNIGGIILLGISMVFLSVGFIMLPQVTSAAQNILDYQYSANASITDATYTGLTSITGIVPLLVLLGYVVESVVAGFLGIKLMREGGSAKLSPASLILSAISLVFIGVGLIMFPIALDSISSIVHGDGHGISAVLTGFHSFLLVVPMLVELGYIVATVVVGFFGIKNLSAG